MRRVWAVATNTIKQAVRMKIAVAFTVLLAVLLPTMALATTGDGTLKGRLQTFVSYGLSLSSFLLCLLTILIAVYSLTNDLKEKQIYTILTKPVRRFQLILGKLLGVILLDAVLLALFAALIYAVAKNTPRFYADKPAGLAKAQSEFFTARASLIPAEVDVSEEVRQSFDKLEKAGQLPADVPREQIIHQLTKQKKIEKRAATVGQQLVWEFHNVEPLDTKQSLYLRFKYDVSVNPPDLNVYSRWLVGDIRQIQSGGKIQTPVRSYQRKDLIRTFHELEIPSDVIAPDGYLAVVFQNIPLNNTVVIFPPKKGLEVLYKADTFEANFFRAVLLVFFRLVFLAVLGILASTFLSFPVAILLCLVVFFTGTISGFITESFEFLGGGIGGIYHYAVLPLIQLLPKFDEFNPTEYIVGARLLSWTLVGKVFAFMLGIKAVLLLLLAVLIFRYKEIAKVII